jgi:hypothetical protein
MTAMHTFANSRHGSMMCLQILSTTLPLVFPSLLSEPPPGNSEDVNTLAVSLPSSLPALLEDVSSMVDKSDVCRFWEFTK